MIEEQEQPDLPSEAPEQKVQTKWEFKPRKDPKWGEVTKRGLVVGRGDNKKVVDPDEVYRLAEIGCSIEEMSNFFGVSRETLKYNFMPYMLRAESELHTKIRNKQIEVALNGHPTMLIWLGKQFLGQSDNPTMVDTNRVLPWTDSPEEIKPDES